MVPHKVGNGRSKSISNDYHSNANNHVHTRTEAVDTQPAIAGVELAQNHTSAQGKMQSELDSGVPMTASQAQPTMDVMTNSRQ